LKKLSPYIIILIVLAGVALLIVYSRNKPRRFNDSITFRQKDKIPYGTYVAYHGLQYMFPAAGIYINRQEPGYWDSLSVYDSNQALIIVSPQFLADEYEMKRLLQFVENGNDVFISARYLSYAAESKLNCKTSIFGISDYLRRRGVVDEDSLTVSLYRPPFALPSQYHYPGYRFSAWAFHYDSAVAAPLGGDEMSRENFLHYRAGKGNLYLHLAPMAFSNYFLLHKNNIAYYEKVFSLMSPEVKTIVWDEYYLRKRTLYEDEKRPGWFSVLMRYPSLKAALLTALCALLLFVLIEMRRKQRYIPVIKSPRNDSLDFVKTIGRLYHDKGDHKNLCRKMASYFLEHVRTRYNLHAGRPDEDFVKNLHYKSGYPLREIEEIISFIRQLDSTEKVTERQLIHFYKQLELFYQKT
jgi:hypothetical protein